MQTTKLEYRPIRKASTLRQGQALELFGSSSHWGNLPKKEDFSHNPGGPERLPNAGQAAG
jgi:hypothetical protein